MAGELVPIGAAVARLQQDYPDVTHSSLHFLERQGLLGPRRTAGGHRLYAPADIQRIRQIKAWQAQRLSLVEIRQRLDQLDAMGSPADVADAFLERALHGDLAGARQLVRESDAVGLPIDVIFVEMLRPALGALGERWANGTATVAQEKEVSAVASELIAELTLRHAAPIRDTTRNVVAACVAGELHEHGIRIISGLLRSRGVEVHYLGVDVAPVFLMDAVARRQPSVVLLSATGDDRLPAMQEAVIALQSGHPRPRVLGGGQAVARHHDIIAACGVVPVVDDDATSIDSVLAHVKVIESEVGDRRA